jgi:L-aspartate oxidase
MMGGIVTDLAGRTSVKRLYACGEVSSTGAHGANRLASNSLLEGLVFAERVARDLQRSQRLQRLQRPGSWDVPPLLDRGAAQVAADDVRRTMWEHAAIDRSEPGLRACLEDLAAIESRLPPGATEELNLVQCARLIAQAALMRQESRGGHFRSDFPKAKHSWAGKHISW